MNVPFLQNATFTGLVSTDEYRTSYEWNKAYDIATFYVQNSAILIEQTTFTELTSLKASNQLKPGQLYKINDFELKWRNQGYYDYTVKSSGVIEPLIVLALSNNKISSQAYSALHPEDLIYYDIDATNSYTWGADSVPGPGGIIPNFKGWITRRVNTVYNIDIAWDWRYITNNCCKFNVWDTPIYSASTTYSRFNTVRTTQGKLYYSAANNNLNRSLTNINFWLPYTNYIEADMYFPTNEVELGGLLSFSPILSTRAQLPTFTTSFTTTGFPVIFNSITKVSNIKIASGFNNIIQGNGFTKNNIGHGFMYNLIDSYFAKNDVLESFTENIVGFWVSENKFGNGANGNIISGIYPSSMSYCNIGSGFVGNLTSGDFTGNTTDGSFINNKFCRIVQNNKFGTGFTNNQIFAFCTNNIIGSGCTYNSIGTGFSYNVINGIFNINAIGENFSDNSILSDFAENTIGNRFRYNNFQTGCYGNNIGNDFEQNIINNDFNFNNIGNNFSNNTIGNGFRENSIGNYFSSNIIGDGFYGNSTGNYFQSTQTKNNITVIDFTGATHVYNSYDKTIFFNANSDIRLSYYNSYDQLIITDPTA